MFETENNEYHTCEIMTGFCLHKPKTVWAQKKIEHRKYRHTTTSNINQQSPFCHRSTVSIGMYDGKCIFPNVSADRVIVDSMVGNTIDLNAIFVVSQSVTFPIPLGK
mgnify:CR=1 FL=1